MIELNNREAEIVATMETNHPDYAILAGRIAVSILYEETKKSFSGTSSCFFYYLFKLISMS